MRSTQGKPVLVYSLEAFAQSKCFDQTLIVYRDPDQKKTLETIVQSSPWKDLKIHYVRGGESRAESVYNALVALAAQSERDFIQSSDARVAIHDVARPLITSDFIKILMAHAQAHQHIVPANKLMDSIKQVEVDDFEKESAVLRRTVIEVVCARCKPHKFQYPKTFSAYKRLNEACAKYTDDASILESIGETVHYLENPWPNPKITTKSDWDYILYLLN